MTSHLARTLGLTVAATVLLAASTPTWNGSLKSNSCEAGTPGVCGDGEADGVEQCDEGGANGSPTSCCTATCELRATGETCRPAAGDCDSPETCTGDSGACPPDAKFDHIVCRHQAGFCDAPEFCDGVVDDCPPDQLLAGAVCRLAAGVCDVDERCTASSPHCPADEKSTAECRPATDLCDAAETCDGVSDDCPADGVEPATTVCRPDAGDCDVEETCTGTGPACPADAFAPDGTSCDDGDVCTDLDECTAGACGGSLITCGDGTVRVGCEECDDGNLDPGDGCDDMCLVEPGSGCLLAPLSGCRAPVGGNMPRLRIRDRDPDRRDQLSWKWFKGPDGASLAEFGHPTVDTDYVVCVYDQTGLLMRLRAPAGDLCQSRPCWRILREKGYLYRDREETPDGVKTLTLRLNPRSGRSRVGLAARGESLPMPADLTSIVQPVTVQLQNAAGSCWEAIYTAPPQRQTETEFKDKD